MIHLFLANGFEELEALTIVDVLRRAHLEVMTVSITANRHVIGAHGISVKSDMLFRKKNIRYSDMLIIPGGMVGVENLCAHDALQKKFEEQYESKKPIAAICAGPIFLSKCNVIRGRKITCYPGLESHITDAVLSRDLVVTDGNLVTGKGPGAALPFAFALLKFFVSDEIIDKVRIGMIL